MCSIAMFVTDRAFSYSFLEDRGHHSYQAEERFLLVFDVFTGLAIGLIRYALNKRLSGTRQGIPQNSAPEDR